eukprot:TRINITY_DN4136_c0_g2_i4.p1 TRINITY_DN4136_c0_g2~~TRINITY_DN4136_c0_g2_i4.p1  ORF type:complete len:358 (-),score=43.22 TRINITY_DN4136_c0_g2_i4:141-1214(-)
MMCPYRRKKQNFQGSQMVANEDTKHCKQCNRCVIAFDHHCKWVNNCIGRKNYKPFIAMIVAVLCFELVFTSLSVIIMLQQSPDGENFASMIVIYISTLLSFTLLILDTNLVLFHIWLIHHGITTYDYIVRNREKKKMKTEPKIEDLEDKEEGRRFFKDATKGTEISPKVSPGIQEREGQSLIVPEVPEIPKSLISQATFNSVTPNELRQTLSPEQRNHDATTTLNSIGRSKLEPLQKFPKYNLNKMTEFVVERDLMCEVSDGQGLATPTKKAVPAPKKSDFVQRELVTKKFEIKSIANPTFKNTNITPIEQSLHAEKEPEQTNLIMSPLNKTEGSIENNVGSLDTIRKAKFFTSENR